MIIDCENTLRKLIHYISDESEKLQLKADNGNATDEDATRITTLFEVMKFIEKEIE